MVGSSARAAVHSLARAGFRAWAVDQFGDRDLTRVAACVVCPSGNYPDALPGLAARFPPGPVLYTGGLENHPRVIAALAAQRELWGNPPDVLSRVRDPYTLFATLAKAGFRVPRLTTPGEPCPASGRWLCKPLRSGGGIGVRVAQPGEAASPDHSFQEFVEGVPMSAVFVNATFFGITQQLIGEPWLHAQPFAYCGNIGRVSTPADASIEQLGREVTRLAHLRGVWGFDFILAGEEPVLIEVNPRYTAGVEVLEHASGEPAAGHLLKGHQEPTPNPFLQGGEQDLRTREAFGKSEDASRAVTPSLQGGGRGVGSCVAKAVYYAPRTFAFPTSGPWDADLAGAFDPWRLPRFADIPESASVIQAGWPVLTIFATGSTPADVRERLQSRAAELDRLFRDTHS